MPTDDIGPVAIALNRFGLGARPDDAISGDPRHFLKQQFDRYDPAPTAFMQLPDAGALLKNYEAEQRAMRQAIRTQAPDPMSPGPMPPTAVTAAAMANPRLAAKAGRTPDQQAARKDFVQDVRGLYRQAAQARMASALSTEAPFVERLVHFWSNHFCVSADDPKVTALSGAFERDAIRPHVLGRFADMLFAVEQHPAMLIYLNQSQSIGPESPAAQRTAQKGGKQRGLNENLAREIMELHTLGVRSGYSQADVTEFARALTGWTVDGLYQQGAQAAGNSIGFLFRPQTHEPGARAILGKTYPQRGVDQAHAALSDFARAPQTATHIATKLARHFAGDTPPPALVDRLAETFTRSDGDLKALYSTLIDSKEAWAPQPVKFKTPWEWTVSALRGLGQPDLGRVKVENIQQKLGQPIWKPGSPAGWDDIAASWAASDALMRRVEVAQGLAAQAGAIDARALAPKLLPAALSSDTADQIGRAESPEVALALLLVSPDFLRR
ncbi:DUF1800 domain-containing protein [Novosphingobium sp. BL-8H]|uniref:DUF1800 domain-containing protein n=1 Tax=Novosphingobium sp. BL-8H TaxID=3127640 RepID=UPI00375785BE